MAGVPDRASLLNSGVPLVGGQSQPAGWTAMRPGGTAVIQDWSEREEHVCEVLSLATPGRTCRMWSRLA